MLGYTVASDGDVEMSLPQQIFEPNCAPELSNWDRVDLIEWLREWERYVENMGHRCTTTGESYENVMVTVKGSVKHKTLRKLFTYVLKKPVADVIDTDVMKALQARWCTLKNEFVPDVTSLLHRTLKMAYQLMTARILHYYEDFNGIKEDNGLQWLIGVVSITHWI
ncbi:LOW QUALITY PROTEIN: hypothetical protein PHMEG_00029251 [Phytophthora megakarya]|uniref:Uncharacterized protein n=1 Tax=Phytophthora megakarya TaxID=4795 RepID=A0A225V446_9STRA|nr:LOW QUALITY PROTEIN: hypothetical protein PHMEG_00029251 [Phytophthora megakarya]